MTFHDMRHTAVALWIATGANDLQVGRRAGHQSVAFGKDRNRHLFDTHGDSVVARLEGTHRRGVGSTVGHGRRTRIQNSRVRSVSHSGN